MNPEDYPDDINDFLTYNAMKLENGLVVVEISVIREALEHYFYLEKE